MSEMFNRSNPNWSDWKHQMKHAIRTEEALSEWLEVSPAEKEAIGAVDGKYQWSVTPYYASLMDRHDPNCPVRLQAVPAMREMEEVPSNIDPVEDRSFLKTRRVVHKYPNRIVFLVSDTCPVYCRHCTRKYHTTDMEGTYWDRNESSSYDNDFQYIADHPEIDDVLLTGGDPLALSDKRLEFIISRLREIPSVNIIRVGSRYPVLLPQRVTPELCDMFAKYHPFWLNTHFNHPKEITAESEAAIQRLLSRGIPVQNQSVLLKGINDDKDTMRTLLKELLRIRVRPYYLYHCDNVTGVSHFRTSLEKGLEIMESLHGFETGFSVPLYVITTPLGKIPIHKEAIEKIDGRYYATNYKKQRMDITEFLEIEPAPAPMLV